MIRLIYFFVSMWLVLPIAAQKTKQSKSLTNIFDREHVEYRTSRPSKDSIASKPLTSKLKLDRNRQETERVMN